MRRHLKFTIVGLIAKAFGFLAIVFAAACGPVANNARVHVNYEQVANFHSYVLSPDSNGSFSAGDGMFIMYRIRSISNTGSEAEEFIFDKHKVVTITEDQISNEEPAGDTTLLGGQLITTLTVQPGETLTEPKGVGCFIKHVLTNSPEDLAHTTSLLDLKYTIDDSQPVSMHRGSGNTSTAIIIGDALPNAPNVGLQQLCNTN
jgi:hypothetical protein